MRKNRPGPKWYYGPRFGFEGNEGINENEKPPGWNVGASENPGSKELTHKVNRRERTTTKGR